MRRTVWLVFGLFVCAVLAAPASVAGYSDRIEDIDHVLAASGYHGLLVSKDHVATKSLGNGAIASITLWMKPPTEMRLRDARQIKFTQSYCKSLGFSQAGFTASAKLERDTFFRNVIGQAPPPGLDADLLTFGYQVKKNYVSPLFRQARLTHFPMKCGGEVYEFDLFQ